MVKTPAERAKDYRDRKRANKPPKQPAKTNRERCREYRARQKKIRANSSGVLNNISEIGEIRENMRVMPPPQSSQQRSRDCQQLNTDLRIDVQPSTSRFDDAHLTLDTSVLIDLPYADFNAHRSIHREFKKKFSDNPFGFLPNIMEHYMQYHIMGSVSQVPMKTGCAPTKFECQSVINKCMSSTILPNIQQRKLLYEPSKDNIEDISTSKHLAVTEVLREHSGSLLKVENINRESSDTIDEELQAETTHKLKREPIQGEINTTPEMCRICLRVNCRVYSMLEREDLRLEYQTLTGLTVDEDDLPPYLCTECSHRLLNFARLRNRSLQAHSLLLETVKKHHFITLESVTSSMEHKESLGSDLSVTHNETDRYDLVIKHEDSGNCTDKQISNGIVCNSVNTINDRKDSLIKSEVDTIHNVVKDKINNEIVLHNFIAFVDVNSLMEPNDDFNIDQSNFDAHGNNYDGTSDSCVKTEIDDIKDIVNYKGSANNEMYTCSFEENKVTKVEIDEAGNISMFDVEK